jgi:hypothetical protein
MPRKRKLCKIAGIQQYLTITSSAKLDSSIYFRNMPELVSYHSSLLFGNNLELNSDAY